MNLISLLLIAWSTLASMESSGSKRNPCVGGAETGEPMRRSTNGSRARFVANESDVRVERTLTTSGTNTRRSMIATADFISSGLSTSADKAGISPLVRIRKAMRPLSRCSFSARLSLGSMSTTVE